MNFNDDFRGGTMCLSKAGLAIGDGAKTGPAIAAPPNGAGVDFMIDGFTYFKGEAATNLPLTAAAAQAALTTCMYLIQIDAALVVTSVKGVEVPTGGSKGLFIPPAAAGKCPIGAVKVATAAATTFTAGTTALDAAGITETYYDLATVPVNPMTA